MLIDACFGKAKLPCPSDWNILLEDYSQLIRDEIASKSAR